MKEIPYRELAGKLLYPAVAARHDISYVDCVSWRTRSGALGDRQAYFAPN